MELSELMAREAIRDLIARYNANGDSGRLDQVLPLFAEDATMQIEKDPARRGHAEIRSIFTEAASKFSGGGPGFFIRHMTSTLQIDILDQRSAKCRCYYLVLSPIGLDHWGRYIDEFGLIDGTWKFTTRRVTLDGRSQASEKALSQS